MNDNENIHGGSFFKFGKRIEADESTNGFQSSISPIVAPSVSSSVPSFEVSQPLRYEEKVSTPAIASPLPIYEQRSEQRSVPIAPRYEPPAIPRTPPATPRYASYASDNLPSDDFSSMTSVNTGDKINMSPELSLPKEAANDVVAIIGKRGSGKCLMGETRVVLGDGRYMVIKDLHREGCWSEAIKERKRRATLPVMDTDSLKMTVGIWDKFYKRRANDVLKMTLKSGKSLKLTSEHPVFTLDGWKPIRHLKKGDRIATPRYVDAWGNKSIGDSKASILGHMIAEGHIGRKMMYANKDVTMVEDFKCCTYKAFPESRIEKIRDGQYDIYGRRPKRRPYAKDKKVIVNSSNNMLNEKFMGFYNDGFTDVEIGYKCDCTVDTVKYWRRKNNLTGTHRFINYMSEWFGEIGLRGKKSGKKFVPDCLMTATRRETAIFLNRIFSGDGSIESARCQVSYSSISERLIDDVQYLLLKFGLHSRKKIKRGIYKGERHLSWRLSLYGEDAKRFCAYIGFIHTEKNKKCKDLIKKYDSLKHNKNFDTIPKEIWAMIKDEVKKVGKKQSDIMKVLGYAAQKRKSGKVKEQSFGSLCKYAPSREKLMKFAKIIKSDILKKIASSDIYWDEIEKIETVDGIHDVYDISVPGYDYHNFVAEGIIVHNSYTAGVFMEELANMPDVNFVCFDVQGCHKRISLPNNKHVSIDAGHTLSAMRLLDMLGNGSSSYIVNLKGIDIDRQRQLIFDFVVAARRINFGRKYGKALMIILEEAHVFAPQRSSFGDKRLIQECKNALLALIKEGRSDGYGMCLITQSNAMIDKEVMRQTAIKIVHRLADYSDLEALKKNLPGLTRDYVESVKKKVFMFGVGQFLCVAPDYISGAGIIVGKTRVRRTEHGGASFLGGGGTSTAETGNFGGSWEKDFENPAELFSSDKTDDKDGENDEEEEKEIELGGIDKEGVDYTTILVTCLITFGGAGMVYAFLRNKKKKSDYNKEKDWEAKEEKERKIMMAAKLAKRRGEAKDEQEHKKDVFWSDNIIYPSKTEDLHDVGQPKMRIRDEDIIEFIKKDTSGPDVSAKGSLKSDDFWSMERPPHEKGSLSPFGNDYFG